jgi:hypothetical protein
VFTLDRIRHFGERAKPRDRRFGEESLCSGQQRNPDMRGSARRTDPRVRRSAD